MAKKNTKGLFRDTSTIDQPEDTYPYGKNGIQDYKKSASFNEPGFILSSANIPYTHMGTVETDQNPIIFSTDDTNSAIGFFNPDTDEYTPIFDDTALAFKMGFKRINYITGQYQKNHKGEYVAVFTDKVNSFRYINCTNPNVGKLEDLLFFLRATAPQLIVSTESGGQLPTGAYVFYIKYAKSDGSETPYLSTSAPVVISSPDGSGVSSSSIRLSLAGCDTTYDQVIIGVLSKSAGQTTAVQLTPISLSATMDILYTGNNTTTVITIDELLVPPAVYDTVGCLTQLNDTIFIGNLTQTPSPDYQKYANLIQVRFISKEVDMNNIPPAIFSGLQKGFAHGEVYALYIRLKMKDGSKSKAFMIPGRLPQSGETDTITDSGVTAKRFQIHDTVLFPNSSERTGTPGLWVNQDETYPDAIQFDSSSVGGENLRNQPVRHHKMPTHRWVAKNFNSGDSRYGKDKLDIIGIRLSGVVVPVELQGIVDSYEILYAERTTANATVLGQSELLYCAQDLGLINSGTQSNFQSSAGNWNTVASNFAYRDINKVSDKPLHIVTNRIRMHPFEMLFNKIEVPQSGCYIQFEFKMRYVNIVNRNVISYGVDLGIKASDRKQTDILAVAYHLDYKGDSLSTVAPTSDGDFLRNLASCQFAPNNTNTGEWNNTQVETSIVGKLSTNGPSINVSAQNVAVGDNQMQHINTAGYVDFEEMFLATLRVLRNNVYDSVLSQSLVSTGVSFSPTLATTSDIFAGDVFPCEYCVNNYGWVNADNGLTGAGNQALAGCKVIRRFICESVANINQRFEITGNIYSKWFPHSPVMPLQAYIMSFDRSLDANQFGYSKDLNTLNNFESITIFNPFVDEVTNFPYRIARGGQFKREGQPASWRTFLALDYYDMPKNRGVIINLAGLDDNLLIHHESALFITQDKTTLQGNVLKVVLGTADIFQYTPLEGVGTKLGYAGTHHDLAAIITPAGYIFVDDAIGQVFMFKTNLKLINLGLNIFFRNYLRIVQRNPYIGNGITMGYDPDYNRLLMTVKNSQLSPEQLANFVPGYQETPEFFATLTSGVSIVYHNGTYMLFQGVNSTEFDCPAVPDNPTVSNVTYTIPENSINGTILGTLSTTDPASSGLTYIITSGNTGGAFRIDTAGKFIVAAGVLNYDTTPSYTIGVKVIDGLGHSGTGVVTVNIISSPRPPVTADISIAINEGLANGTAVTTVSGTDPRSLVLTFAIVSGNAAGVFTINSSTGAITVLSNTHLVFAEYPVFNLVVSVTNTASLSVNSNITIALNNLSAPVFADGTATVKSNVAIGTLALTGVAAVDDAALEASRQLIYTIQSESVPGAFTVGLDPTNATTFLKFLTAITLTAGVTYTMVIRATDPGAPGQSPTFDDATFTIIAQGAYQSVAKSGTVTKNDCADEYVGSSVTYNVAAGAYTSFVSQADADAQAQADVDANKQTYANAHGTCTFAAFNYTRTQDFTKTCSAGQIGSTVSFSRTYYSTISTMDAQTTAMADSTFTTAGQSNANAIGTCTTPPVGAVGILVVDIYSDIGANLTGYVSSTSLVPTNQPVYTGLNFYPNDGTPAANCWALASDIVTGAGTLDWRFEFNIARLLTAYPLATSFEFKISGRDAAGSPLSGAYSLKNADAGSMTMIGSPGSYVPGTSGSTTIGFTSYSGVAIGTGADGTHGIGVGSVIMTFTYDVATKTITMT